uniref:Uncharacterized protein n=1 Tax=Mesocestoides corti TaxID=53468 RepID=A0A5K3ETG3_MESCO
MHQPSTSQHLFTRTHMLPVCVSRGVDTTCSIFPATSNAHFRYNQATFTSMQPKQTFRHTPPGVELPCSHVPRGSVYLLPTHSNFHLCGYTPSHHMQFSISASLPTFVTIAITPRHEYHPTT